MRAAVRQLPAHPASWQVAVAYGNHILASAFLVADKSLVLREAESFLAALRRV